MNKFEDKNLNRLIKTQEREIEREPITRHNEEMQKEQELKEKKIVELKGFLKNKAEELKKKGLPITDDCRIDISLFNKRFPKLESDLERTKKYQEEWDNRKMEPTEKKETAGEQLEMLKTAIFNKFLDKKFVIVRSSKIDDIDNGVDNIIIEKDTGNIVSAFDEVNDEIGEAFRKKVGSVMDKNRSGAKLKYGLSIDPTSKKIIGQSVENIPIFYLSLSKKDLEKGIKKFSSNEISKEENELFEKFMSSIYGQIKELFQRNDVSSKCKEKMRQFVNDLKQI